MLRVRGPRPGVVTSLHDSPVIPRFVICFHVGATMHGMYEWRRFAADLLARRQLPLLPQVSSAVTAAQDRGVGLDLAGGFLASGVVARYAGRFGLSARLLAAAHVCATRTGDQRTAAWAVAEHGELRRVFGRPGAQSALIEARSGFERLRDGRGLSWTDSALGQLSLGHNQPEASMALFGRAAERAGDIGDQASAAWAWRGRAEAALMLGEAANALALAGQAADLFEGLGHETGRAYALRTESAAHLMLGEAESALSAARACVASFSAGGEARGRAYGRVTLGAALLASGDSYGSKVRARGYARLVGLRVVVPPRYRLAATSEVASRN